VQKEDQVGLKWRRKRREAKKEGEEGEEVGGGQQRVKVKRIGVVTKEVKKRGSKKERRKKLEKREKM